MTQAILRNPRLYLVQNGLAGLLFVLLLGAEVLRHLLHSFPGTEILWQLTSLSNQTVGPILNALGLHISNPFGLLAVLCLACLVPLVSWRCRNWLGTAVSGHAALGALVVLTWWALKRAKTGQAMASLSDVFDPTMATGSVLGMVGCTTVMAVLCIINHAVFFHGAHSPRG